MTLLTGVKIPRNKGGHFPFRKSQLDSRTFGVAGLTGLWPRYHSRGVVWCSLKLKNNKISRNKGGHFPFRKSQLDSRTLCVIGPMGLWPCYHSNGVLFGVL